MRQGLRPFLVSLTGFLIFTLVGCGPPQVTTDVLLPAKSHEAAQVKRVAVLPFSGTSDISNEIEAMLVKTRVAEQPYFTVVERTALQKVLTEQAISLSGTIDDTTAAKVGKLVGAEGVIMGVVKTNVAHQPYQETRSRCVSQEKKGILSKCTNTQQYKVQCTKSDAYFSFTPKIVNVATGRIIASEVLVGHDHQERCEDPLPDSNPVVGILSALAGEGAKKNMRSDMEMLGTAKAEALRKFQQMVAPHYVSRQFVMLEDDDTKPPPAAKDKVTSGIKWAKEGRLDRACELWQDAYGLHPQGYAIYYNLGLCAEMVGKLPEALEYYEKADRLTGKPVKEINEALGRVRRTMTEQQRLAEQMQKGVTPPPTIEEPRKIEPPVAVPVSSPAQRPPRKSRSSQ